mmetsp:Transcript_30998/g.81391  ORF Transcript_30998/g.81391 Transcript_30998/m.81391 type:complete len:99 (+) Transcript_30998:385-681(+)
MDVYNWDVTKVVDFIAELGLPHYCDSFEKNRINGARILGMEQRFLPQLGITKFDDQKVIMEGIEKLRAHQLAFLELAPRNHPARKMHVFQPYDKTAQL